MMGTVNTFSGTSGRPTPSVGAPTAGSARQAPAQSAIAPILLTHEQAAAALGLNLTKFHELRAESWMPKPVHLGARIVRWARAELEAAVAAMPRQDQPSQPHQLLRGKVEAMKRRSAEVSA